MRGKLDHKAVGNIRTGVFDVGRCGPVAGGVIEDFASFRIVSVAVVTGTVRIVGSTA
jgi:hypothetical protein